MKRAGPNQPRILLVDDEPDVVAYLHEMLVDDGFVVTTCTNAKDTLARVATQDFDVVVSDVRMPDMTGTDLMAAIHERRPEQLVLLMTAYGSVDLAVKALQMGACDFITKPFPIEVLLQAIRRSLREREMRREIVHLRTTRELDYDPGLVTRSPAMKRVRELATRVARSGFPVFLSGESGVGKGVVARFIHDHSLRSAGPFVQVNCAALPTSIAESELFGARRGAYTDARADRDGLFRQANHGTLFLDEVGDMAPEVQSKVLQALESGRVRPLGAASEVETDVRVVTATNQPIEDLVRAQTFRADLYYRLAGIRIHIPPLRQRPEDVVPLVDHFLERACHRAGSRLLGISSAALRWLLAQPWHGNVRELASAVERAVVLAEHDVLMPCDFDVQAEVTTSKDTMDVAVQERWPLAEVENAYLRRVLEAVGGNKTEAARVLCIDRRTLYRRLGETDTEEAEVPDSRRE